MIPRRGFLATLAAIAAFPMKAFARPQGQTFRHAWTACELAAGGKITVVFHNGFVIPPGYRSWRITFVGNKQMFELDNGELRETLSLGERARHVAKLRQQYSNELLKRIASQTKSG